MNLSKKNLELKISAMNNSLHAAFVKNLLTLTLFVFYWWSLTWIYWPDLRRWANWVFFLCLWLTAWLVIHVAVVHCSDILELLNYAGSQDECQWMRYCSQCFIHRLLAGKTQYLLPYHQHQHRTLCVSRIRKTRHFFKRNSQRIHAHVRLWRKCIAIVYDFVSKC